MGGRSANRRPWLNGARLAVVITIMVLEMKPPGGGTPADRGVAPPRKQRRASSALHKSPRIEVCFQRE
jgi:hypothetical protein